MLYLVVRRGRRLKVSLARPGSPPPPPPPPPNQLTQVRGRHDYAINWLLPGWPSVAVWTQAARVNTCVKRTSGGGSQKTYKQTIPRLLKRTAMEILSPISLWILLPGRSVLSASS